MLTPPDFLSLYLQRHLHVVREQLSGAEALRHLYVGAVDVGGELGYGVQTISKRSLGKVSQHAKNIVLDLLA